MDDLLNAFIVFFVVIDPVGLVPIFLGLTQGFDSHRKRRVALRGSAIGLAVLVFFAYFGEIVLSALSIGMPAFRIAGGALLFWIAFEMLFEKRIERKEKAADEARTDEEASDLAVFPLAVPLIAGPGAITSVLLLMDQHGASLSGQAVVLAAAGANILATLVLFLAADAVHRALGRTFIHTATRVLGIVLAALATQTVISGLIAVYPPG